MIAEAVFEEGEWSQAFPQFGVERRGAPVQAFTRIDDEKIGDRSHVYEPDFVIVQDPSLIEFVDVTEGLEAEGMLLINSSKDPSEFDLDTEAEIVTIDATNIALEYLGLPIMNTSLLGAFASISGLMELESIEDVIMSEFPGEIGEKNVAASTAAYQEVSAV